ncbi:MAG: class I SAM-dependent methyltransferase [Candidatus Hermodarchaeota archaeon]|nr:class I SAM-dependent methyltransferase [Candidatus Hermodarchaeota archaeon]
MVLFDDLALVYDEAIDWKNRLNRELPFLESLLEKRTPARILDLACGSGRHATALAKLGHEVTGLDASREMIDAAIRLTAKEEVTVQYLVGDMQEALNLLEAPFDLIVCLGNSLALLPDIDALKRTVGGIHALLAPTGTFVAQVLNFQEIRYSRFRFFPMKSGTLTEDHDVVFARFFEPFTNSTKVTLVFAGFIRLDKAWKTRVNMHEVLQLDKPILVSTLRDAGFQEPEIFGGYDGSLFSPLESRNLIAVSKI